MTARKTALAAFLAALLVIGGIACEPVGEEGGGTDTEGGAETEAS